MKLRALVLSGAALMLLAGAAQAGQSTRAERETTRQLNLQAAQNAEAGNQTSHPLIAATDAASNMGNNAPPAAAPTVPVQTAAMAPSGIATSGEILLSSVSNPPSKIATANVLDNSGQIVGAVQKVEISPQGAPTHVVVALIGKQERVVVLDAAQVSYDAARNEITAQASGDQIKTMSSAG